jgi:hypothetical protein
VRLTGFFTVPVVSAGGYDGVVACLLEAGTGTTALLSGVVYSGPGGAFGEVTGPSLGGGTYQFSATADLLGRSADLKVSGGGTTLFEQSRAFDAAGNVTTASAPATTVFLGGVEQVTTSAGTTTTRTYYLADGRLIAMAADSVLTYLASDGLGSPTVAQSPSGGVLAARLYSPYGGVRYASGSMPTYYGFDSPLTYPPANLGAVPGAQALNQALLPAVAAPRWTARLRAPPPQVSCGSNETTSDRQACSVSAVWRCADLSRFRKLAMSSSRQRRR